MVRPGDPDADARRDRETVLADVDRGRDAFEDARGVLRGLIDARQVLDQDRELIASEPRGGVVGP